MPMMSSMMQPLEGTKSRAYDQKDDENYHLILNSTWLPQLTITGIDGIPSISDAGNSMKKQLKFRCSLRLPPTLKYPQAEQIIRKILLEEGPETFGCKIEISNANGGNGLDTKPLVESVKKAFFEANQYVFNGNLPLFIGCGGSIPFMEFFSTMFPQANFLLTGVGFPDSNAHAANENLDLEFCRKLIGVIALTINKL